jgi:class 3 adenylate cyclase/tetratricopeptide (TPR) repeat protein
MSSVETVSIVFTDLVGSTELLTRVGPAPAEELRGEHFSITREALVGGGGREVKNLGDGLMVAFPSAGAAVTAAVDLQQRLHRRNARATHPLQVRVGMALGDATNEDGDYFGPPVVHAARLCAKAAGGQILVTELVKAMAGASGEHRFADVGALELKGIPDPVPTYEIAFDLDDASAGIPLPPRLASMPEISFVGRGDQRDALAAAWERARAGSLQVALLAGDPGIGKTRLATYAALIARDQGATVLYGRSDEDLGISYQPWIEALTHYVNVAPEGLLRGHVERRGGEIARIVPHIRGRVGDVAPQPGADPETERYLLFSAVGDLLHQAAEDTGVVLILDDLHWADRTTLSLLRHLVSGGAQLSLPLLVIGAYRDSDLTRSHPLTEVLADLRREPCVSRLQMQGLAREEIVDLLEAVTGHDMDEEGRGLAAALELEAAGNPFFVGEMLRNLLESGGVEEGGDGRWRLTSELSDLGLPESVREVIGRRVERLGTAVANALTAASVIGREFDLDVLAQVLKQDEDELLDLLDQATAAALVVERGDAPGRFGFGSAMIEQTLYEDLGATRRARLHARVGEALESIHGESSGRLGELAYHWAQATRAANVAKAVGYARRAGEHALAQLAPDDAIRWFESALAQRAQESNDPAGAQEHCRLLLGLGEAQRQTGDAAFRETLLAAARLARDSGDADALVRAVLANNRGFTSEIGNVDHERIEMLEAAAGVLSHDDPRYGEVLLMTASELVFGGELDRRRELADEGLRIARRSGDAGELAFAIITYKWALTLPETLEERVALAGELRAIRDGVRDPLVRLFVESRNQFTALDCGDIEEVDRCTAAMQAIAAEVSQPYLTWVAGFQGALTALLHGRLDEADALAAEAFEVANDAGEADALVVFASQLATVRLEQGRIDEVIDLVEEATEGNPHVPAYRGVLARCYCELGRFDEARELLEATDLAGISVDFLRMYTLVLWADVVADLADEQRAAALYDLLAPWAGQCVNSGAVACGSVQHYLGRLAAAKGDAEAARRHLEGAAEVHRRLDAPLFLARSNLFLAPFVEPERAGALLAEADALARERDARSLLERVESAPASG